MSRAADKKLHFRTVEILLICSITCRKKHKSETLVQKGYLKTKRQKAILLYAPLWMFKLKIFIKPVPSFFYLSQKEVKPWRLGNMSHHHNQAMLSEAWQWWFWLPVVKRNKVTSNNLWHVSRGKATSIGKLGSYKIINIKLSTACELQ